MGQCLSIIPALFHMAEIAHSCKRLCLKSEPTTPTACSAGSVIIVQTGSLCSQLRTALSKASGRLASSTPMEGFRGAEGSNNHVGK